MHLDLGFGFFFGGGGVWVFCVYSRLVFVLLMLYDHALHSKCIIDLCAWLSLLWVLIGLVWVSPIRSLFLHVMCSCIRSFPSFLFWTCIVFYSFFFISLSLSHRTYLWHPNRENPLRLEILVKVLGHLLLLFLLFLLTSSSVTRRPTWTSLRTSKTVAFIWNAR